MKKKNRLKWRKVDQEVKKQFKEAQVREEKKRIVRENRRWRENPEKVEKGSRRMIRERKKNSKKK